MLDRYKEFISEDERHEYAAEIRSLRAIYYYYLLDLFGNVPIVTSTTIGMKDIGQSTRSELFRFVESELTASLPYLTYYRSNMITEFYSHITVPVAAFVMMKMALNAEIWLDERLQMC